MTQPFSNEVMVQTVRWARFLASDWKMDAPDRLHSPKIAGDGSPEWHPDFMRWITSEDGRRQGPRNTEQRLRTTKVMRRLRRVAVREYEVIFRVLMLGERLEDTTRWLNERALKNKIPYPEHRPQGPHYVYKDALALLIAGVEYTRQSW